MVTAKTFAKADLPPFRLTSMLALALASALVLIAPRVHAEEPVDGRALVRSNCSGCHHESAPGYFERISSMRKTPEGWVMTIFRMHQVHGLTIDDATRDGIVRYLSGTNGIAPSESAQGRYALERRPNVPDMQLPDDLQVMCARCHSAARVSLQRRDADEWLKLVHMHVGQWPTLEYQASSRDRLWWQTATTEVPKKLQQLYPLETAAWKDWKARTPASLEGSWIVHGHAPGRGDYHGTAAITKEGADEYAATYSLTYEDGKQIQGSSKSIVYTGYEWRGSADLATDAVREVFAVSEDGSRITGRWFAQDHSEVGGDWNATRANGPAALFSATPSAVQAGKTRQVTLVGRGLDGPVSFGPGTTTKVISRDGFVVTVSVTASAGAAAGARAIKVGRVSQEGLFAVYSKIDRVQVEPGYAIGRVGGGRIDGVTAQFEAVAYIDGPADAAGKKPGVRLGVMPAAWSLLPYNAQAEKDRDVQFAGTIDQNGLFTPAGGGPNKERKYSANNVGNLFVVAKVKDGDREVEGRSHLIVTVQRWNTPPIY